MFDGFGFPFGRGNQDQSELVIISDLHEAKLNELLSRLVVRDAGELPKPLDVGVDDLFERSGLQ
jgi:hypothetical protein